MIAVMVVTHCEYIGDGDGVVMILFYWLSVGKERWWIVDDGGDDVVDHVDDFVDDVVLLAALRQGEVVACQN